MFIISELATIYHFYYLIICGAVSHSVKVLKVTRVGGAVAIIGGNMLPNVIVIHYRLEPQQNVILFGFLFFF